jgi:hypothetical protein
VTIDDRIREALAAATAEVHERDDLLARVRSSLVEDRRLRTRERHGAAVVACLAGAVAGVAVATLDRRQGALVMDWWVLEIIWFAVMIGLALWLGPFIRRFGKAYAADVFRANPRTGKSFIVLMDVAYYLIFVAYTLFLVRFEPEPDWEATVNANQLQSCTVRIGGILLIVGVLHGLNVLTLPVMGRLFTLNRRLDDEPVARSPRR